MMHHQYGQKPRPKTVLEIREARWEMIKHLRFLVPKKGKEDWEGVTYTFPVPTEHNLEDSDIMLLCGGYENLGAFKSITRVGDNYVCFIAHRETTEL